MPVHRAFRSLPVIAVAAHTLLTVLVFLVAMLNPARSGLMPLLVFMADLPFSIVIHILAESVTRDGIGYYPQLLNDMAWFLVLGGAWWYGIGFGVGVLIYRTRLLLARRTM